MVGTGVAVGTGVGVIGIGVGVGVAVGTGVGVAVGTGVGVDVGSGVGVKHVLHTFNGDAIACGVDFFALPCAVVFVIANGSGTACEGSNGAWRIAGGFPSDPLRSERAAT